MGTHTATIFKLPTTTNEFSRPEIISDEVIDKIFAAPIVEQKIKSLVEGSVAEFMMRLLENSPESSDSPFDSVYLSALLPDNFTYTDIDEIETYSHVIDISDTIGFKDVWED